MQHTLGYTLLHTICVASLKSSYYFEQICDYKNLE